MGKFKFKFPTMLLPNSWLRKLKGVGSGRGSEASAKKRGGHYSQPGQKQSNPIPPPPPTPEPPYYTPCRASYYIPSSENTLPSGGGSSSSTTSPGRLQYRLRVKVPPSTHVAADPPRRSAAGRRKLQRRPATSAAAYSSEDDDYAAGLSVSSSPGDVVVGMRSSTSKSSRGSSSEVDLPPILTKPAAKKDQLAPATEEEKAPISPHRRSLGFRVMRTAVVSPRISSSSTTGSCRRASNRVRQQQKQQQQQQQQKQKKRRKKKKGLMESFAVVKLTADPQRDFRESMVEMIVQNDMRSWKELEELLACYLTLNSDEYHDVILDVFQQISYDLIISQLSTN